MSVTDDDRGVLAALAGLPGMYPARLRALLAGRAPVDAWAAVVAGAAADLPAVREVVRRNAAQLASTWRRAAERLDVAAVGAAHRSAGVDILVASDDGYPPRLADDQEAPAVLFCQGDLAQLDLPSVAIVGTRRCTHAGREVARWLGRSAWEAGAAVVSGLALGIDGAAHGGALVAEREGGAAGGVVAVVGSGLDQPYPRQHRELWDSVRARGVVVGEAPLGTTPVGWRFPARNRIIAALASVVVVVESHAHGGSLVTARLALDRQRTVLAVPGPIRSPASAGTNALLRDGALPLLDLDDLAVAMSMAGTPLPVEPRRGRSGGEDGDPRAGRTSEERAVLEAVSFEAVSTETVIVRTGLTPGVVAVALRRLEADDLLIATSGGWWERAGVR